MTFALLPLFFAQLPANDAEPAGTFLIPVTTYVEVELSWSNEFVVCDDCEIKRIKVIEGEIVEMEGDE